MRGPASSASQHIAALAHRCKQCLTNKTASGAYGALRAVSNRRMRLPESMKRAVMARPGCAGGFSSQGAESSILTGGLCEVCHPTRLVVAIPLGCNVIQACRASQASHLPCASSCADVGSACRLDTCSYATRAALPCAGQDRSVSLHRGAGWLSTLPAGRCRDPA